jgi:hypothetical protein
MRESRRYLKLITGEDRKEREEKKRMERKEVGK